MWRTNWKVTTRQIEQVLYRCRIPDCCWSRTVFHDEWHCRILTIHRCSDLSWVHFAKRRRHIWTEGLDQRKHQNGPVLEVTTCCLQGKYGVEIRIMSVNEDNSHSWVRIMAYTSWSRTWTTTRAHPQEPYLLGRELGLMSNQENDRHPITQRRRNWSIFFVKEAYLETMMERLNIGG